MSLTLTIRDETASGKLYNEVPLVFPSEQITLRELIRERVYQEVQDYNNQQTETAFRGLVQPSEAEQTLNAHKSPAPSKAHKQIDWKQQYDRALEAFQNNGFLVLVGERQAEDLDEVITLNSASQVSFVKLALLVGG